MKKRPKEHPLIGVLSCIYHIVVPLNFTDLLIGL